MNATNLLHFTNRSDAILYLWVTASPCSVTLSTTTMLPGRPIRVIKDQLQFSLKWNRSLILTEPGIWALHLDAEPGCPGIDFSISAAPSAWPFIIPGPGIVPSHFPDPGPALLFAADSAADVWIDVPEQYPSLTLSAWISPDHGATLKDARHEQHELNWMPKAKSAYRVARVDCSRSAGWWSLHLDVVDHLFRLSVWNGLPLFLNKPDRPFPYARLRLSACDGTAQPIDCRFTVYDRQSIVAMLDSLRDETAVFYLPAGSYTIKAGHGFEYATAVRGVRITAGSETVCSFTLERRWQAPPGWVSGDQHMHSVYEDGGQYPDLIVRAARAYGRQYIFITDTDIEGLLAAGITDHNLDQQFLAMPGQEIANDYVHMNFLNPIKAVDPGMEIPDWIVEAELQNRHQPVALMLNHPAHLAPIKDARAYFRSWWVFDKYDAIVLVENYDFQTWFDRLNRHERIVGLWTTDTHDITFMEPGKKGTYLYAGDSLSPASVINGLLGGRCFNTCYPGALLLLEANGKGIGETVDASGSEPVAVSIQCQSQNKITSVELIGNGLVVASWTGLDSHRVDISYALTATCSWIIARCYTEASGWPADGTSMEPLRHSGCTAFTNPIYLSRHILAQ